MSALRHLKRMRIGIYAALALLVLFAVLRYDIVNMSKEGSSPLLEFEPGTRLFVDRWFGALGPGDVVLFEGPGEVVLLGRVEEPPATASEEVWKACAEGSLWIVGDRPGHPLRDSRVLGPIPRGAVTGRISFGVRW